MGPEEVVGRKGSKASRGGEGSRPYCHNARGVPVRRGQVSLPRDMQAGNVATTGGRRRFRVSRRGSGFCRLRGVQRRRRVGIPLSFFSRRLPAKSVACAGGGPAVTRWQARCSVSGP